ncbi:carbohydrate ABC transporter permease [Jiangella asiatica]|uniref:Carbohydrate ABC transporter permease n=1 Tax=Jiangella asiatica TaxID=2530372 RepID=A0A4R5DE32_9ACTN|nr:carbohydrate ABC transporter permease [Jiangella asiatica]TDE10111.1 carbohydrate ABC transporter permease [Jiangella asiatica]
MSVPTTVSGQAAPARAGRQQPAGTKPRKHRGWRSWRREIIVSIVLLPICLIWIYPFLWMVGASLKTDTEIFGSVSVLPEQPQWENYSRAWYEANIGPYFWNTIFITAFTIAVVTITTAMIGYVIGRYTFPGKKVLVVVLIATLFLPEGYTIIPVFDLINQLGLSGSLWGIILAESGGAHVIQIMLFAGYFRQLPNELDEAARIDGAGFLRIFWKVMLPLTKPAIATAIILSLMRVWNSFLIPLVLTLPRPELRTLAVGVYSFQGENMTDWSGMAAASTIALLPIVLVFLALQRYFVEGVAGAVRG